MDRSGLTVALKTELENIRETHRLDSASQEGLTTELRVKLEEAEKQTSKDKDHEAPQRIEDLQSELGEKQKALEEAQRAETELNKKIAGLNEQLREQSRALDTQHAEVEASLGIF